MEPMADWDDEAARESEMPLDHREQRRMVQAEVVFWRIAKGLVAAEAGVNPTAFGNWLANRGRGSDAWVRRVAAAARKLGREAACKHLAQRDPEFAEWDRQRREAARGDGSIAVPNGADPVKDILP